MIYVHTSAALKVFRPEPESTALRHFLATHEGFLASELLRIELARGLRRLGASPALTDALLDAITLIAINDEIITKACALTDQLKSLDAIHLATALHLHCTTTPVRVLTYDAKLSEAATRQGLAVLSPS